MMNNFLDKLLSIQTTLKAPKDKYNSFGKYSYRSAEGILEAVKPLLGQYGVVMTIRDEIVDVGGRVFVKAVVTVSDCESSDSESVTAFAEIATEKKGMDVSQITGTASSYARKYALNGLFLIDDTKDADTDEYQNEKKGKAERATKEKEYSQVAKEKISAVKAKSLEGRLQSMGVNIPALLAKYGVTQAADLTEEQHLDIINKLRKHEEKGK